jgi:hypothetical protein
VACIPVFEELSSVEVRLSAQSLPAAKALLQVSCFLLYLFFAFSAEKLHVKSQNHLNQTNNGKSNMEKSCAPTPITQDSREKTNTAKGNSPSLANLFVCPNLAVTPLLLNFLQTSFHHK